MTTLEIYQKLEKIPFGKNFFTYLVCLKLPYFKSIKPYVLELQEGHSVITMKDRRCVHNHLNTIHAIALCNLCEMAMAMTTEASIPKGLMYIPKGMTVEYKKKAKGDLRAICNASPGDYQPGDMSTHVDVYNANEEIVMSADIILNIKEIIS